MKKVLFLCTGNSARSQMAEAFLNNLGKGRFQAFSAGLEPKGIHPYTRQVMKEIGYDLEDQTSKHLRTFLGKERIHTVIVVCAHAAKHCPTVWPGVTEILHWHFEDPVDYDGTPDAHIEKFRKIRDMIKAEIENWLQELDA
jgi:arsenate reductase